MYSFYWKKSCKAIVVLTFVVSTLSAIPTLAYSVVGRGYFTEGESTYNAVQKTAEGLPAVSYSTSGRPSGVIKEFKSGSWMYDGKGWWYKYQDGSYPRNGIYQLDDKICFFDAEGYAQSGIVQYGENHYYFSPEDLLLRTGWVENGGRWYYFSTDNGAMLTGWQKIGGNWYFLGADGSMQTGWVDHNGTQYYLDASGIMASDSWIGNNYVDKSGALSIPDQAAVEKYLDLKSEEVFALVGRDLRACFDWTASFPYSHMDDNVPSHLTPSEYFSLKGFNDHTGDCYVYAAVMTVLARRLGYDANMVMGYVPRRGGGLITHGWCEVNIGGTIWILDPNFTAETGRNGYMIRYGQSGTWRYQDYGRVQ